MEPVFNEKYCIFNLQIYNSLSDPYFSVSDIALACEYFLNSHGNVYPNRNWILHQVSEENKRRDNKQYFINEKGLFEFILSSNRKQCTELKKIFIDVLLTYKYKGDAYSKQISKLQHEKSETEINYVKLVYKNAELTIKNSELTTKNVELEIEIQSLKAKILFAESTKSNLKTDLLNDFKNEHHKQEEHQNECPLENLHITDTMKARIHEILQPIQIDGKYTTMQKFSKLAHLSIADLKQQLLAWGIVEKKTNRLVTTYYGRINGYVFPAKTGTTIYLTLKLQTRLYSYLHP